jgi:hypothetical protein
MSNIKVKPIDLFNNTSITYDQTKTSLLGKITTKTVSSKTVVGAPLVKYRNTITGPEAITPAEIVATENNRLFVLSAFVASTGLGNLACYNINPANGEPIYVGTITIKLPAPPTTTYTVRGLRIIDDGISNWKIFILVTANVATHAGIYLADNIALSDFNFVPPVIPTATASGQKAVYRYDTSGPTNILDGTGLCIDKTSSLVYVHRGVAATHLFSIFNYSLPVVAVGLLGQTTDTFSHQTGNLPVLSGTLLLTNSEDFTTPTSGPNSGFPCVVFHTTTFMYRGRMSELTNAAVSWPSLEFANNLAEPNLEAGVANTLRAAFSNSLQRAILLVSSSTYPASVAIKRFENSQRDLVCTVLSPDNNEALAKEMYKFKMPIAPVAFDSREGYLFMASGTTGARGIYIANFDSDSQYDLTSIISPVLDVKNQIITRFTAGFVRPDLASPLEVYYRTSGFGSPTGGWIQVAEDLDFGTLVSPTGEIQIKIMFKLLSNETTNSIQLYSAGLVVFDRNSISENWEYSHDDSSAGNPSRVAFRLKKSYPSVVPQMFFRARDLSDNLYVQSDTVVDSGLFEYSTDGGVNWLSLGAVPNTVGTLLRYTFVTPPGVDIRPSLLES